MKFYVVIWVIFCISAFLCAVFQSILGLGVCFLLAGIGILIYDLVIYRRLRILAFWLIVLGGLMAIPDFYAWYLNTFSRIYSGDNYMQLNVTFAIGLYAVLSVLDGGIDFVMRKIRCRQKVQAYASERTIFTHDDSGDIVRKHHTVITYNYNGKEYEVKEGAITEGPGTIGKNVYIFIDRKCPAYARTGQIQGKNIASIVRGTFIIWLFVVIAING